MFGFGTDDDKYDTDARLEQERLFYKLDPGTKVRTPDGDRVTTVAVHLEMQAHNVRPTIYYPSVPLSGRKSQFRYAVENSRRSERGYIWTLSQETASEVLFWE